MEASENTNTTVFDDSRAFSEQLKDYFRLDLQLAYKWSKKNSTQEIALDIRNATNRQNPFYVKYNIETGEVDTKGLGMMPNLLYRISF